MLQNQTHVPLRRTRTIPEGLHARFMGVIRDNQIDRTFNKVKGSMHRLRRSFLHFLRATVRLARPWLELTWVRSVPKLKPLERIAILLDSGVGDTLMATPMLRE